MDRNSEGIQRDPSGTRSTRLEELRELRPGRVHPSTPAKARTSIGSLFAMEVVLVIVCFVGLGTQTWSMAMLFGGLAVLYPFLHISFASRRQRRSESEDSDLHEPEWTSSHPPRAGANQVPQGETIRTFLGVELFLVGVCVAGLSNQMWVLAVIFGGLAIAYANSFFSERKGRPGNPLLDVYPLFVDFELLLLLFCAWAALERNWWPAVVLALIATITACLFKPWSRWRYHLRMADLCLAWKEAAHAESHLVEAQFCAERFGANDWRRGWILLRIAGAYREQGRHQEAVPLYEQALPILESAWGARYVWVAAGFINLALSHDALGNYEQGARLYRRVLAVIGDGVTGFYRRRLPVDALIMNNLAVMSLELARFDEAAELLGQAESKLARARKPNAILRGTVLRNWAQWHMRQKDYVEAEKLCRRAESVCLEALPNTSTGFFRDLLAEICRQQGRSSEAETLVRQALDGLGTALGEDHPELIRCWFTLAALALHKEDLTEAEQWFQRALTIHDQHRLADRFDLAESLEDYASLLRRTNRIEQAQALEARARRIRNRIADHQNCEADSLLSAE